MRNKILGIITQIGTKKIAVCVAGIVATLVVGGAAIIGLNQKEAAKKPVEPEVTAKEEKETLELQQWQEDYARVLFEVLYMPFADFSDDTPWDEMGNPKGDLDEFFRYAAGENMYFGLLDTNGDEVPELFVEPDRGGSNDKKYMFTTGNGIDECYLGRMHYVDTEQKEIVRVCHGNHAPQYVVYKFNGQELEEQFIFGEDSVQTSGNSENYETVYLRYNSATYEQKENITKEEYDNLYAKYNQSTQFEMEMFELTWHNILTKLNVNASAEDRGLLENVKKVCSYYMENKVASFDFYVEDGEIDNNIKVMKMNFNGDGVMDYAFNWQEFYCLLVSGEDGYHMYNDLLEGTYYSYYAYVEGEGKLIRNEDGRPGTYKEVYEINSEHKLESSYMLSEEYLKAETGELIQDAAGHYTIKYYMYDGAQKQELTEEQYTIKCNELKETDMYDGTLYVRPNQLLSDIQVTLAVNE